MSILLDENSRVVIQGITGRDGTFYGTRNLDYGTNVVAGTNPRKAGTKALDDRVPVYATVAEAVEEQGANASLIFVPAAFCTEALLEAGSAGLDLVVCITDGVPAIDMMKVTSVLRGSQTVLVGPNCPGLISPGKANLGIIPPEIATPGPVGLVSRSGTLTYQIANELTERGIGQSTCIGIGGDPVVGSSFIDVISRFEADPETEAIVMIGEIGGDAEERAADYIAEHVSKPCAAYIAGFSAPPGKRMGHAGAIITGSSGTAEGKAEALEAKGIKVGRTPTQVAEHVASALG